MLYSVYYSVALAWLGLAWLGLAWLGLAWIGCCLINSEDLECCAFSRVLGPTIGADASGVYT